MTNRVALIGAGAMGGAIATRQLETGTELHLFDPDTAKAGALVAKGAKAAASAADAGFDGLAINSVLQLLPTTIITPRKMMGGLGAKVLLGRIHQVRTDKAIAIPVEFHCGKTTRAQT